MVIALLSALLVTVGSGLVLYALEDNAGPLAGIVTSAAAPESAAPSGEGKETGNGEHELP